MYGFTINCDGNSVAQLRKIDAALEEAGVHAKVQVGQIESHFTGMGEKVKEVMSNIKSLLMGTFIAGGAFAGFEFIKSSKEMFDAMEKSVTRVNTVLRSTNFKAGMSQGDVTDIAGQLNKSIVQNRSEILDAQGMLLSFTGIKGPVFGATTKAVADFATFYKEDMTSAALQIGKALNDPIHGMNRLQRQGVAFTDEQKKQIKNYQQHGELLKAQQVILKELHTEFGGQAAAFAKTDEGKIQMDQKKWEDLKLEIGEIISKVQLSLLPVFAQVRDFVKEAFESGPVQFFIKHIGDLLSIGLKLIPMWLIYKGILLSTSLITSVFSVSNGILTATMGSLTVMTDGATVAVEGFTAAFSATAIGAIAVALGLVVEHIISMNAELDKAIDKKFKLSENKDFFKSQSEKYNSIKERLGNLGNPEFGLKEKQELYHDIQSYLHDTRLKMSELHAGTGKLGSEKATRSGGFGHFIGVDMIRSMTDSTYMSGIKKEQAFKEQYKSLHDLDQTIPDLKDAIKMLASKGVKPPKGYTNSGTGIKDDAYTTSSLAGARGGLGEAKEIHIHIDTMQKIEGFVPADIKTNAQSALQILVRAVNNLAGSQGSTM